MNAMDKALGMLAIVTLAHSLIGLVNGNRWNIPLVETLPFTNNTGIYDMAAVGALLIGLYGCSKIARRED